MPSWPPVIEGVPPAAIAGYNAAEGTISSEFGLVTNGAIDAEIITRFQWNNSADIDATELNRIKAIAHVDYTAAELAQFGPSGTHPTLRATVTMFMVTSNNFVGIPTPDQIRFHPTAIIRRPFSALEWLDLGGGDKRWVYRLDGPTAGQLQPGTKYWVMLQPTLATIGSTPSATNDREWLGFPDLGRALSVWTNRPPAKPVITSPSNGVSVGADTILTFSFTADDPDSIFGSPGSDLEKPWYTDIAGIQVQYAPQPVPGQPAPVWQDIQVMGRYPGGSGSLNLNSGPGYYIHGQSNPHVNSGRGVRKLWEKGQLSLICGSGGYYDGEALTEDALYLPAGDWQVRLRSFDFGNPFPSRVSTFPPGGLTNASQISPSTMSAANTSEWSTPININIATQVPTPVLLAPIDGRALTKESLDFSWKYRNTAVPPFAQSGATIYARKVGQSNLDTLAITFESNENIDPENPSTFDYVLYPLWLGANDLAINPDGWRGGNYADFQADTGLLVVKSVEDYPTAAEVHGFFQASNFSSSYPVKVLEYSSAGGPTDSIYIDLFVGDHILPDTTDIAFNMSTYVPTGPVDPVTPGDQGTVTIDAYDESDVLLDSEVKLWPDLGVGIEYIVEHWGYGFATMTLPVGTARVRVSWAPEHPLGVMAMASLLQSTPDFSSLFDEGQYEWSVKTIDEDFEISSVAPVENFWIVPGPGTGIERPDPEETDDVATLGCGTHRVFVYRRGGQKRVGEIKNISHVDWGRVRDDISTAKIVVSDWDVDCGNLLANLKTWAYELVIFRDNGYTSDRVWEGPITLLTYETDKVTIDAKDVMAYAYRRIIKQAMNDSGTGNGDTVVNRALRVLQNVLAPDDPNLLSYIQPLTDGNVAMQYRSIPAYARTAFEEIDDMAANAGLDYTAVGRAILLWGTRNRIGTLPEFRDKDLGNAPIVSEYGMSAANVYAVSDGNGVYGEATRLDINGEDTTYGLIEMLSSTWASDSEVDSGTFTQQGIATTKESFEAFAERSIADRFPPPVVVRVPDNTTLNSGTPISIQHLVPGVAIPLRSTSTLRTVHAVQKLDSIKVTEEAGNETIAITLSAFSHEDSSVEEG